MSSSALASDAAPARASSYVWKAARITKASTTAERRARHGHHRPAPARVNQQWPTRCAVHPREGECATAVAPTRSKMATGRSMPRELLPLPDGLTLLEECIDPFLDVLGR